MFHPALISNVIKQYKSLSLPLCSLGNELGVLQMGKVDFSPSQPRLTKTRA